MDEQQQTAVIEEPARQDEVETPLESVSSICTVLAVGLFLMTFVFQNYVIPSGSMEKTLLVGDHVFVDRITLAPPTKWAPFVHYRDVRLHEAEPGDAGFGAGQARHRHRRR
jgi:signal peptidase I